MAVLFQLFVDLFQRFHEMLNRIILVMLQFRYRGECTQFLDLAHVRLTLRNVVRFLKPGPDGAKFRIKKKLELGMNGRSNTRRHGGRISLPLSLVFLQPVELPRAAWKFSCLPPSDGPTRS